MGLALLCTCLRTAYMPYTVLGIVSQEHQRVCLPQLAHGEIRNAGRLS